MLIATITRPTTIAPTYSCQRKIYLNEDIDVASVGAPKPRTVSLEPVQHHHHRTKSKHGKMRLQKKALAQVPSSLPVEPQAPSESTPSHSTSSSVSCSVHSGYAEDLSRASTPSENWSVNGEGRDSIDSRLAANRARAGFHTGQMLGSSISPAQLTRPGDNAGPINGSNLANGADTKQPIKVSDRAITATVSLLKGGFLPGDSIPITISVSHTKPIKSMCGVVLTLYRIGRLDPEPVLLTPTSTSNMTTTTTNAASKRRSRPHGENMYPHSRTGLGGLSLTSAGTNHVFRMDLAQATVPLLISPTTLTAAIKTSLRIPGEDEGGVQVIPTIANVPGGMIDFRYHVEVLLDLQGKMASAADGGSAMAALLPRMTSQVSYGFGQPEAGAMGVANAATQKGGAGACFIDTEVLRRERNVVACAFHVVVGTRDSERARERGREWERKAEDGQVREMMPQAHGDAGLGHHAGQHIDPHSAVGDRPMSEAYRHRESGYHEQLSHPQYDGHAPDPREHSRSGQLDPHHVDLEATPAPTNQHQPLRQRQHQGHANEPPPPIASIPLPDLDEPEDEKARLRQAEARLLPSAPPTEDADAESDANAAGLLRRIVPSAPTAEQVEALELERGWLGAAGASPSRRGSGDDIGIGGGIVPRYSRRENSGPAAPSSVDGIGPVVSQHADHIHSAAVATDPGPGEAAPSYDSTSAP